MIFGAATLVPAVHGADAPRVVLVEIASPVTPVTAEIVAHGLNRARDAKAAAVILRLDTPGGLMDAMRESIARIEASPVPVITWVGPSGSRAASAGFFILEAGDVAAMAPGTNTGAAHPVTVGTQPDAVMRQKILNDAAASLRSLTARRGRNTELAEQTVRESRSFTEREALDGRLIEVIAASEEDLLKQVDGRAIVRFNGTHETLHTAGAAIEPYRETVRERVMSFLADPNLALIFLLLGALGIYAEFNSPGMILPGVLGSICALVGLAALSVLPLSALGILLMLLAGIFFALEMKFTSHGVLGAGGAIALTLGSLLLIDTPIPEMRIHLSTALAAALPFALITAFLVSIAARARRNKVVTGVEGMVGAIGIAAEDLNPAGRVVVRGEYWNAVSRRPIVKGAAARVIAVQNLELKVEPAEEGIPRGV